ncbi:hypothetical protein [Rhodococcus sp. YH3-3]|uniref:hypothetical protein n=1 Tax=Rhodococcus sp. YH3-3 TaxID=1803579 RepID=UPI0007DB5CD2|nr:hypothetical protein [Rhodococcus sp. YH3-3]
MSRIDRLPENILYEKITRLDADVTEFKNRQFVSGKSGVLGYLSQTTNTWDYAQTVNSGSTSHTILLDFLLLYTGDGSQDYPMINPFIDVFCGSPVEANRLRPGKSTYVNGANSVYMMRWMARDKESTGRPLLTDPLKLQWVTGFAVTGSVPFYVKFYASGTSAGTTQLTARIS